MSGPRSHIVIVRRFDHDLLMRSICVIMNAKKTLIKNKSGFGNVERSLIANRTKFRAFLLKRLKSKVEAEDVLQDFCVRVLDHKEQLCDADRMEAWLYTVLRSTLNDHFRRSGRSVRLSDAFATEMLSSINVQLPEEQNDSFCECAMKLVPKLRPAEALLIQRIDVEYENRAALAEELGIKPGTLNVRLHRARGALGKILIAHCGQCCREGYDDCYCPPAGCEHSQAVTHC